MFFPPPGPALCKLGLARSAICSAWSLHSGPRTFLVFKPPPFWTPFPYSTYLTLSNVVVVVVVFPTTMPWDYKSTTRKKKKKKYVRVTQYATKLPMDHWRNQRAIHKIAGDKLKWKHNDSNSMEFSKNNSKREDHSDKVYFKNSN